MTSKKKRRRERGWFWLPLVTAVIEYQWSIGVSGRGFAIGYHSEATPPSLQHSLRLLPPPQQRGGRKGGGGRGGGLFHFDRSWLSLFFSCGRFFVVLPPPPPPPSSSVACYWWCWWHSSFQCLVNVVTFFSPRLLPLVVLTKPTPKSTSESQTTCYPSHSVASDSIQ